ncbi:NIF family HAD-type phosphatase [Solemya elarraichensis gill symbiont]|uniref:Uncharacterized protein n=1 Tax=Solemya elarraichensis gill symbiont TaxID=1918949 RepID=A0A1T2KZP6_9GAMM|nr:NIF family HAD-type phosphatase [Solemya elarraichensis gill symbiont]OOZ38240.1 hypothetical protein BOW52_08975 [Solemya elarraichensis gill symbiont]
MLLFLDVDGVLLGKKNPRDISHSIAAGCDEFIDFSIEHFDCYWLTSHCKGSADTVLNYLKPYVTDPLYEKIKLIQATDYRTFKTEALHGDFIWIDDAPSMYEIKYLEENNLLHRWFQVNTRQDYHALEKIIQDLNSILKNGFL